MTVPSGERMQRLLAMVPWIASQDGPTIAEICERFQVSRKQLLADLDVVWLVGLPPYTPDALIDVVQEGGRVWIHYPDVFDRPQRLTPEQGLALLTAGASLLALPGTEPDGALARGVRKLADVLGVDPSSSLEVDLGSADPGVVSALREAIERQRRVRLDYYSYGRDARTEREVDPVRIEAEDGALYLLAHCWSADGPRRFRLDRVHGAEVLDTRAERGPAEGAGAERAVFEPDDDDPRVTVELDPEARWVVEQYPTETVEEVGDGRVRARMAIAAVPWLERLLLRCGPAARIVDAPDGLAEAGAAAAERILARYRRPAASGDSGQG